MPTHNHIIQLSPQELAQVQRTIKKGKHNARVITRARILLWSHRGGAKDAIALQLGVNPSTVQDVRDRFRAGGLDRALTDAPRPGQPKKITDEAEAHLIALAASSPPDGYARWTLGLFKERLVAGGKVCEEITIAALHHRLKQRHIKPWREKNVVHPERHA